MLDFVFSDFHFLRPVWLAAIAPAVLVWVVVRRRASTARWRAVIAPHLLSHLTVGGGATQRFRPIHLITAFVILGAIGAAGPTWQREVSPFAEDTAPLIVALDLSPTMNATDVQPSRLHRAKAKLRDILEVRRGSRTALVAYAGTAHMVLPLCEDPSVFETFIEALTTDLMPARGKEAVSALALAERLLANESVPGSILFLTDGIAAEAAPEFAAHRDRTDDAVLVLALGTTDGGPIRKRDGSFATDASGRRVMAPFDLEGLEALSGEAGVFVAGATADDEDVQRLQRRVQSNLRQVQQEDETARWQDAGYWFVYPVALLGLFWFRRGWTVRWASLALALAFVGGCAPGASAGDTRFADLWLTPDQQGRWYFDRYDFAEAADRFEDPFWKGVALYRAGDLLGAIDWLARANAPEASFDLGNAYAQLHQFREALASYEVALSERPEWVEAQENRDRMQAVLEQLPEDEEDPPPDGEPNYDQDDIEFDATGKKSEQGESPGEGLSDEDIAELWLRRLQTTPAEFLKRRFEVEMLDALEDAR